MFKQLFILLYNLIVSPEKTWKELYENQDITNENYNRNYLYPIFGLIAALSFVGVFFYMKEFSIEFALKVVIRELLTYVLGYYLVVLVLFRFVFKYFNREENVFVCERFTGYSSAMIYAIAMVYSLFPSLFFVQIFIFYAVYVIWHGTKHYLKFSEENQTKFTIFASILIILSPFIIQTFISLMMPGLNT
jgi:low affinity Fe/Cu permease